MISRRGALRFMTLATAATLTATMAARASVKVRVGVLKFGTVNWELDAMKRNGIDAKHGVDVEIIPFAGEDATGIALQGGSVDMIVTDWLWVSRQRAEGGSYVFAPYSTSVGAIMVPGDSPVQTLADLKGRTLGVAGGPLDKNWLLHPGAGPARFPDRSRRKTPGSSTARRRFWRKRRAAASSTPC